MFFQSCSPPTVSPETTEDSVVDEGDSVTIQCNFDDAVESCTWTHNEPMNENNQARCDSIFGFPLFNTL